MLRVEVVTNQDDKEKLLTTFDPAKGSWIVSDLKSKSEIQERLLLKRSVVPSQAVMRASEFWRKTLIAQNPSIRFGSRSLLTALLREFLDHEAPKRELAERRYSATTLLRAVTEFLPIYLHPQGEELIQDWFRQNPNSFMHWGHWYIVTSHAFSYLKAKEIYLAEWSRYLVGDSDCPIANEDLVVDLGAHLRRSEFDWFLSRASQLTGELTFILPSREWISSYPSLFPAELKNLTHSKPTAQTLDSFYFERYPSCVAEAKAATQRVRDWLEGGVPVDDILVVASRPHQYFSLLSAHLSCEGIDFFSNEDFSESLRSHPSLLRTMARLRILAEKASREDYELCLFNPTQPAPAPFHEFKTKLALYYSQEDAFRFLPARSLSQHEEFQSKRRRQNSLSLSEFEGWLRQHLDGLEFEEVFECLEADIPHDLKLSWGSWSEYMEQLSLSQKLKLSDATRTSGVQLCALNSADWVRAGHRIYLGLSETQLRPLFKGIIPRKDVETLRSDLGFDLQDDEVPASEFELEWQAQNQMPNNLNTDISTSRDFKEYWYFCPSTDSSGQEISPSAWFMEKISCHANDRNQGASGKTDFSSKQNFSRKQDCSGKQDPFANRALRWDVLQKSSFAIVGRERGWAESELITIEDRVLIDLGKRDLKPFGGGVVKRLSASSIERYLRCPFLLTANKLFQLSDEGELDYDLRATDRGRILHKVLELLLEEPFDTSNLNFSSLFAKALDETQTPLIDNDLWDALSQPLMRLISQFVALEKKYRAEFPTVRTLARELLVQGWWNPKASSFSRQPLEAESVEFRGVVDRVDEDSQGRVVLYDYKLSAGQLAQGSSWLEKNQLQLLLYAAAIEQGLSSLERRSVVGAFYVSLSPPDRTKGLRLIDGGEEFYLTSGRGRNMIDSKELSELYARVGEKMNDVCSGLKQGMFIPRPNDLRICGECRWKVTCRAPHTNM